MLKFPKYATICLETLQKGGFEANFVGGCVRDAIMGRNYDDIDITTNAKPSEVIEIFEHTVPTGIEHGTVTVIIENKNVEVTTYRTEGSYSDARHPDSVNYVSRINEDLARRDFTVNSIAYNPQDGITDIFGGIEDIKSKTLRAVGEAEIRFKEDALRILRAFRFSSVLDMEIEDKTKKAAFKLSSTINKVSGERVLTELIKLSCGNIGKDFIDFINTGALKPFGIISTDCSESKFKSIKSLDCEPSIKFAVFLSLTNHNPLTIKDTLKPSNHIQKLLSFFNSAKENEIILNSKIDIKKAFHRYGEENIMALIRRIEIFDLPKAKTILENCKTIKENNEPYSLDMLNLKGDDLKKIGVTGREIGIMLEKALNLVIIEPSLNDKNILLNKLQ